MKFGFRTPSIKRSLSAATRGVLTRAILREVIPYYGKRGIGWLNPKKAAYNHLYNMTTASSVDIFLNEHKKSHLLTPAQEREQVDYEDKINALSIYKRGLEQCETTATLNRYIIDDISNESLKHLVIRQLYSYVKSYVNKPRACGFDFCEMCDKRLLRLKRISPDVKELCLIVVDCIRHSASTQEIFTALSSNNSLNSLISLLNEQKLIKKKIVNDNYPKVSTLQPTSVNSSGDLNKWDNILYIFAILGIMIMFLFIFSILI